jgi:hypothetical protein
LAAAWQSVHRCASCGASSAKPEAACCSFVISSSALSWKVVCSLAWHRDAARAGRELGQRRRAGGEGRRVRRLVARHALARRGLRTAAAEDVERVRSVLLVAPRAGQPAVPADQRQEALVIDRGQAVPRRLPVAGRAGERHAALVRVLVTALAGALEAEVALRVLRQDRLVGVRVAPIAGERRVRTVHDPADPAVVELGRLGHAREREALPVHQRRAVAVVLGVAQAALLGARAQRPVQAGAGGELLLDRRVTLEAGLAHRPEQTAVASRAVVLAVQVRLALVHAGERARGGPPALAHGHQRHGHGRDEGDQDLRARLHGAPPDSTAP